MDGLTKQDITNVRKAYVTLAELEQQIERAKNCQFECSEVDERCKHLKAVCQGIIQTYGPAFPSPKE